MEKEELVDLLTKIINCDFPEKEEEAMIALFEKNIPHPDGINLLYDCSAEN